jgi:predicted Ser/Thr protein kinase
MPTMERPMTAAGGNQKVRDLETQLRDEQRTKKRLVDEVESLKKELHKQSFAQFTHGAGEVSVTAGRLPAVPGVREISMEDLEFGEQIGQGGFSVIHKGFLNGTPVAIKKIFDPKMTDDLLAEIQNEIVMQAILRHPNIALLLGVMPKIPNIVIVFEHVAQGSLFNLLHMKKQQVDLDLRARIKIALASARVFQYMHALGIVHRDIKSHNILIDKNLEVKVCDFGLARFKVREHL